MRQSIKPFVIERKKKRQPKREAGPLFTKEQLFNAAEPEAAPAAPPVRQAPNLAAPQASAPPPRILSDLTATLPVFERGLVQNGGADALKKSGESLKPRSSSDKPSQDAVVEKLLEVESHPLPTIANVEALPAPENEGRISARSKARRQRPPTRKDSFSTMS